MIETLDDLNAQACCCTLTLCPVPTMDCQSVSASLSAAGYMDSEDTSWIIYKREGTTTNASSIATTVRDAPLFWYDGELSEERSTNFDTFIGFEYDSLFTGGIGLNPECFFITAVADTKCTASGTSVRDTYFQHQWGNDTEGYNNSTDHATKTTRVASSAVGDETTAHVAWSDLLATYDPDELVAISAWEADYAAWEAEVAAHTAWEVVRDTHDAWQGVKDDHDAWLAAVAAHDEWQAIKDAHDAWVLDPVGPEPPTEGDEPPMAGDEPPIEGIEPPEEGEEPPVRAEPVLPYPEPPEFYTEDDCICKITTTVIVYTGYWGFYGHSYILVMGELVQDPSAPTPGSSAAPATDNAAVLAWMYSGEGDAPAPGTGTIVEYVPCYIINSSMDFTESGDPGTPLVGVYGLTEPMDFNTWMTGAEALIDPELNFDETGCLQNECSSLFYKSTEPVPPDPIGSFNFEGNDAQINKRKTRVRFQIPATWLDQVTGLTVPFTGTYFKITYDIIEEPEGWDDAIPTVFRTFFSEDNVLEWTPTGTPPTDPDDAYWFTDWITLDPPSVPGTRRIVNIRFVCRENWFIGEVPQVTGEAVTLPDP